VSHDSDTLARMSALPPTAVRRWTRPLVRFLAIESASGFVLLLCTIAALLLANTALSHAYAEFWHTHIKLTIGHWELDHSLAHWVNDGLMALFFFVVGLEIKREIVAGELRDPRKAALPVMAALGGMLVPAGIYFALQYGQPGARGWGIPMATDIAFVVGFLAVLGKRVPVGLKILLLALAIADDIGAVLVIAVFYTSSISLAALVVAAGGLFVTVGMNLIGVRWVGAYVLVGIAIWLAFLVSGVHPTVAGVILGLLTPASPWIGTEVLAKVVGLTNKRLVDPQAFHEAPDRSWLLSDLATAAKEATSPLERLEHGLHPWVAFGIMPIFALANAGVHLSGDAMHVLAEPVTLGVLLGLVVGKPLGIVLFSWLAVQLRLARLPAGVNWPVMVGAGCLAGIGFTMSLFVAGLALDGELLDAAKVGTLGGSAISAVLGCTLLLMFLPRQQQAQAINATEVLTVEPAPPVALHA
jgi:Na+:H+ antiporter, NhaA family